MHSRKIEEMTELADLAWPRVLGQQHVKRTLMSSLSAGRLPHAYLFYGPEGVGKDATAIELARVLQCETVGEVPCDKCRSCEQMKRLQHPDVKLVCALPVGKGEKSDDAPLAKLSRDDLTVIQEEFGKKALNPYHRISIPRATIIKINSIREIRRDAAMSTTGRKKKIFIISRADEMGEEAANTLLKTLEEPNPDTILILTTARRDALLPTILSRCQNVRFDQLLSQEIQTGLEERLGVGKEHAMIVSRLADGSFTKAVSLLEEDIEEMRSNVLSFIRGTLGQNVAARIKAVEDLASTRDRVKVSNFLSFMLVWFRDAMVLENGGTIINIDQQEDIKRFLQNFPQADLARVIRDIESAISLLRRNVYITLILLQLLFQMRENILPTKD
ncbi:MAG TPA: AAA family ATPase [Bacteroidota bacterium]